MMKQATKQAVPAITIFPAPGKNFHIYKMSKKTLSLHLQTTLYSQYIMNYTECR